MQTDQRRVRTGAGWSRATKLAAIALTSLVLLGAGTHLMMTFHGRVDPPPAAEFGFGPRASTGGLYRASIETGEPLRVRRLHSLKLSLQTADHAPVEGASVEISGGMPQHGHGFPTRPRVTRDLGGGGYLMEGLKFNMGGWWELKLRITTPAGTDSVTFNLDL